MSRGAGFESIAYYVVHRECGISLKHNFGVHSCMAKVHDRCLGASKSGNDFPSCRDSHITMLTDHVAIATTRSGCSVARPVSRL